MNHTTVGELLERLTVAEPCARVVFNIGEFDYQEFDIQCTSPTTQVTITPESDECEERLTAMKGRLADLSSALEKIGDHLEEPELDGDAKIDAIQAIIDATDFKDLECV